MKKTKQPNAGFVPNNATLFVIGAAVTWAGMMKASDVGGRRLAEDLLLRAVKHGIDWCSA